MRCRPYLCVCVAVWPVQGECSQWKLRFADNLHARAKEELERLTE